MQETANYGFHKPEEEDFIDPGDWAAMMDAVDAQLKIQEEATGQVTEGLKEAAVEAVKNKADRYKKHAATLPSSGWTGSAAPYTNTLTVPGITAGNDICVLPDPAWTLPKAQAWAGAMVLAGEQGENTLTLKAYGDKPEMDLPIVILIGGALWEGGQEDAG